MKGTMLEKILNSHLVEGKLKPGEEIGIKIDQTLLQDATGTIACLEFEAMGKKRVETELSVLYIDHNTLQLGFENMDDHLFLQSCAERFGLYFSPPGNGICHQVHLERFSAPGKTLLGSDSHTPTAGGAGMLGIGAGGLDVAVAMAGEPFYLPCPSVMGIYLTGRLPDWVSAKDVILEILRRLSVKGGVGKVLEYFGPGVEVLSVPERATICNMGTETGATSSIFPSDEITRSFLKKQGREGEFNPLAPEPDAEYDQVIELELSQLEPMVALPGSPDRVVLVREAGEVEVRQVNIGSCTNSSYRDLVLVAEVLKGKRISPLVSLNLNPGSRQVLKMLADEGKLSWLIEAGARIFEPSCDGCIGMGSAPATGINSLRTYNRNFPGRSGTKEDRIFLVSPETAVASALTGKLTDPRTLGEYPKISLPEKFWIDDAMILPPEKEGEKIELRKGPNIKSLPDFQPLPEEAEMEVLICLGDNISTDEILPGGSKILPLRSNLAELSKYVFYRIDRDFVSRARGKIGVVVAGENYGQGSSREHAALAPRYLGVRLILAKSFARIHRANLINFGIIPALIDDQLREKLSVGIRLFLPDLKKEVEGSQSLSLVLGEEKYSALLRLTARERKILLAGGLLNLVKFQG